MSILLYMVSLTCWAVSIETFYIIVGSVPYVTSLTLFSETKWIGSVLMDSVEDSVFVSPLTGTIWQLVPVVLLSSQRKGQESKPCSLVQIQEQ